MFWQERDEISGPYNRAAFGADMPAWPKRPKFLRWVLTFALRRFLLAFADVEPVFVNSLCIQHAIYPFVRIRNA